MNMFLHLGWGGVYMDANAAAAQIRDYFSIADQAVKAAQRAGRFQAGERLTVVGSDFYGSYWLPPGRVSPREACGSQVPLHAKPLEVLAEALGWLKNN
jgi:hypothetical protein